MTDEAAAPVPAQRPRAVKAAPGGDAVEPVWAPLAPEALAALAEQLEGNPAIVAAFEQCKAAVYKEWCATGSGPDGIAAREQLWAEHQGLSRLRRHLGTLRLGARRNRAL